jgi:methylmalonyl-CoA mutase
VSEFANLGETLPHPVPAAGASAKPGALPVHRDAAAFEALRNRTTSNAPEVLLLTLGTFAESRARAGFAANFFSAGGLRTREVTQVEAAPVVCLCGTDERYAEEAVARAAELKKAGAGRVMLAGRPGPREAELRAAGIDGFLFVGCDVVAVLEEVAR